MKLTTKILLITAAVSVMGASLGANYHYIGQMNNINANLEACALDNNVHPSSCKMQAVVVTQPRIAYVEKDLLDAPKVAMKGYRVVAVK